MFPSVNMAPVPVVGDRRSIEDVAAQLWRRCGLGHLEDGVAGVGDDFCADLLADGGQRPAFHLVRQGQRAQDVGQLLDLSVKLKRRRLDLELPTEFRPSRRRSPASANTLSRCTGNRRQFRQASPNREVIREIRVNICF